MERSTISGVMLLIVLALVAPVHTTFAHLSLDDSPELNSSPDAVSQVYIPHDWISIDGNEDFLSQAALEGWNGSGSENEPIIIEGYSFSASLHLFRAIHTDVHFVFRSNFLDGVDQSWCGFYLNNVSNGRVYGLKTFMLNHCVSTVVQDISVPNTRLTASSYWFVGGTSSPQKSEDFY